MYPFIVIIMSPQKKKKKKKKKKNYLEMSDSAAILYTIIAIGIMRHDTIKARFRISGFLTSFHNTIDRYKYQRETNKI